MKVYHAYEAEGFRGRNHSLHERTKYGVGSHCGKGPGKWRRRGLKLSITEGGKEGTSQVIASCRYSEDKFHGCSRRKGVGFPHSAQTLGVGLRTRTRAGEKKKVRSVADQRQ